jgi:hypothetical protein
MPRRILRALAQAPIGPDGRGLTRHQAFIRSLPCVACGKPAPSECACLAGGTEGCIGLQPNDRYTVPLCGPTTVWDDCCHSRQHQIGRARFWSELGIDPLRLAECLWRISGDRGKGRHMVMRAPGGRAEPGNAGVGEVNAPHRAEAVAELATRFGIPRCAAAAIDCDAGVPR